jgi:hypothetical protein
MKALKILLLVVFFPPIAAIVGADVAPPPKAPEL